MTTIHAVNGVSLQVQRGETFAIVGESGCGKSTLARLLLRLIEPSAGQISYDGRDLGACRRPRCAGCAPRCSSSFRIRSPR
jgi:ABC-type oligopeptide transport system ATPase subunit